MKALRIPLLAGLDGVPLAEAVATMRQAVSPQIIDCVNWPEFPHRPEVTFHVARSATALYIHFAVNGPSLRALCRHDGDPVHTDSCVEFFMKQEDEETYRNFEFNPSGVCDASIRLSRSQKLRPLSPAEYTAIRRHPSVSAVVDTPEGDFAWELTVAIPFPVMGLDPEQLPEKIWGNFYKCGDATSFPHYLSWSPVHTSAPDFHRPDYFAPLLFV
jgi:hypothetical protein